MSCVKCTHETAQLFGHKFFVSSELGGRGGRRQISMALTSRATHIIQWPVQWVAKSRDGANPIKTGLSSDCRLQLACMKLESLVNAYQPRRVEYVLGSCTHRPSHHGSWQCTKSALGG